MDYSKITNLTYSVYLGQDKAIRKLAIKELGAEKVAEMDDAAVYDWLHKSGYVPLVVACGGIADMETIYLVKQEDLNKMTMLSR